MFGCSPRTNDSDGWGKCLWLLSNTDSPPAQPIVVSVSCLGRGGLHLRLTMLSAHTMCTVHSMEENPDWRLVDRSWFEKVLGTLHELWPWHVDLSAVTLGQPDAAWAAWAALWAGCTCLTVESGEAIDYTQHHDIQSMTYYSPPPTPSFFPPPSKASHYSQLHIPVQQTLPLITFISSQPESEQNPHTCTFYCTERMRSVGVTVKTFYRNAYRAAGEEPCALDSLTWFITAVSGLISYEQLSSVCPACSQMYWSSNRLSCNTSCITIACSRDNSL